MDRPHPHEYFANLSADRPDIPAESLRRTRRLMAVAIPDAVIPPMTAAELLEGLAVVGLRKSVEALRGATR